MLIEDLQEQTEDIVRLIAQTMEGKDRLSAVAINLLCVLLLIAGNETPTNLLGNGALAFFKRPALGERVPSAHNFATK